MPTQFVYMFLYRVFIWLYPKLIWIASFSNPKARAWIQGRRTVFKELARVFSTGTGPVIWMHCSSLGEFEQGLPLLEQLKKTYPSHRVLLSFFSPSGYEIRKNHPAADHVCYLPMDSVSHAKQFLNIVNPSLVVFIKYEYWFYFLREINSRRIPLILASGIFRKSQPFFTWYGTLHRRMLSFFSWLFVQNQASANLLQGIGFGDKTVVTGDTRFDRVLEIAASAEPMPAITAFCNHADVLVAGSTWTEDDEELDHFTNTYPAVKCIIAPHDIGQERLKECLSLYKHSILYSDYQKLFEEGRQLPENTNVLVIDNMGLLSKLYRYATICYIGGGFGGDGIHNILEAAVYRKPVVFGPVYDKYAEAEEMIRAGGAFSIIDALELEDQLKELLEDRNMLQQASAAAGEYVKQKAGATAAIIRYIQEKRLLIS